MSTRFRALNGSNTRPRAVLKQGFDEKLLGQPIYFDKLRQTSAPIEVLEAGLTENETPAGSIFTSRKIAPDLLYIKAKGDIN